MPTRVNNNTVVQTTGIPDRIMMRSPKTLGENRRMAQQAVRFGRTLVPKLSGRAAKGMTPYWSQGYFGIRWDQSYLWFQETGIRAFTMTKLAGKVIPMWIDDPTGKEARDNPKAKRRTISGRRQILIFRKAAKIGQRKRVARRDGRGRILGYRSVPMSYPGAPGRISQRHPSGRIAGKPPRALPHVGVRWRHPGLEGRGMLQHAMLETAKANGLRATTCYAKYGGR